MIQSEGTGTDTRRKILEAAGEVFTRSGFHLATVREICSSAGVNVAAVNYHFRDKENLYLETIRYWRTISFEKYPLDGARDESKPFEERLNLFIRSFVCRVLDQGPPSWFGKLVAREYIDPTSALEILIEETIRPTFTLLSSIIRGLLGETVPADRVNLCAAGIMAQCLHFHLGRSVIFRLFKWESLDQVDIDKIAEHVTRFSLCAIRGMAEKGEDQSC